MGAIRRAVGDCRKLSKRDDLANARSFQPTMTVLVPLPLRALPRALPRARMPDSHEECVYHMRSGTPQCTFFVTPFLAPLLTFL